MLITKRFDLCFVLGLKTFWSVSLPFLSCLCVLHRTPKSLYAFCAVKTHSGLLFWWVLNKHGLRSYTKKNLGLADCRSYCSIFFSLPLSHHAGAVRHAKVARWTKTHRPTGELPLGFPGNCYLSWINVRFSSVACYLNSSKAWLSSTERECSR